MPLAVLNTFLEFSSLTSQVHLGRNGPPSFAPPSSDILQDSILSFPPYSTQLKINCMISSIPVFMVNACNPIVFHSISRIHLSANLHTQDTLQSIFLTHSEHCSCLPPGQTTCVTCSIWLSQGQSSGPGQSCCSTNLEFGGRGQKINWCFCLPRVICVKGKVERWGKPLPQHRIRRGQCTGKEKNEPHVRRSRDDPRWEWSPAFQVFQSLPTTPLTVHLCTPITNFSSSLTLVWTDFWSL